MKTTRIMTTSFTLTLLACNNAVDMRNVSDFKICDTCVKEEEPIEIIHRTKGPISNKDFEFYYHMVGVTSSTRDTFNFLSPNDPYVTPSDNKRVFSFSMMKIVENLHLTDSVGEKIDTTLRDIKKVAIDKDFSDSYLRYPTVRGILYKKS
jgi:hypothetical protein